MTKKACPESVIRAGAHLVRFRHGVKGPDEAKHVGLDHADHETLKAAFNDAFDSVHKAMFDLREFGVMEMEWGPGLDHMDRAGRALSEGETYTAWVQTLCAHDCFRRVLDKHGIENPTNDQIAKVIGYANFR